MPQRSMPQRQTNQQRRKWFGSLIVGLLGCASCQMPPSINATSSAAPAPSPAIQYQVHDLPRAKLYSLLIPPSDFSVTPALSPETARLESFGQQQRAIAAINGGFFDPQNQQSTSYVMQQGEWVADPTHNQRLMNNPDLAPYLDKILNRSEFRRYQCEHLRYAIARHREPAPSGCRQLDTLGAGPQLLPELTLDQEGFTATDSTGNLVRDALGSSQPNARSAVGITADGRLLWVMVAQKPGMTPSGLSLPELAAFMKSQGAETALNLDGGSSSALLYRQQTVHGKLDADGNPIRRPVKSVLLLSPLPR